MTDKPFDPTESQIAAALNMHTMPATKWRRTAQKTLLGTLFVVLGIVGAAKWQWSVWVVIGLCVFGAHIISNQIIAQSVKNLIPLLKAVVDIVRGKGDA